MTDLDINLTATSASAPGLAAVEDTYGSDDKK